ncbi:hypothetical protein Tco_1352632 [Tanacetum coccineum]
MFPGASAQHDNLGEEQSDLLRQEKNVRTGASSVRMKFDNPQQLKHALADYGVANGYQLWYYRSDGNSLLVYCGRDVEMGRMDGLQGVRKVIEMEMELLPTIEQDFTRNMERRFSHVNPDA